MAKAVKAYWWKDVPNFGDAIAPYLLERFADIKVEWGTICQSQIASIGSILEHIPPRWDGFIIGSGRLIENSRLHLYWQDATIISLVAAISQRYPRQVFFRRPRTAGPRTGRSSEKRMGLGHPSALAGHPIGFPVLEESARRLYLPRHQSAR